MLWWVTIATLYLYYRRRLERPPRPAEEYQVRVENEGEVLKALFTAVLALTSTRYDPVEVFERLDWDTVFFVSSFPVLVHGLERTGVLRTLSQFVYEVSRGSMAWATLLLVSGITSIFLANVAVALTFISPLKALNFPDRRPLWSALVLGTNLGGASIPATSEVFAMAVGALRHEGLRVDMGELSKIGLLTSLVQLAFSALYLLAYFRLSSSRCGKVAEKIVEKFKRVGERYERELVEESLGRPCISLRVEMPEGCKGLEEEFKSLSRDREFMDELRELVKRHLGRRKSGDH